MINAQAWLPTVIFVPLVGFAMYRRFKRTFGRQRVSVSWMVARAVLLALLCVLLGFSTHTAAGLGLAAGGAFGGVLLAMVGLSLTRFDATADGKFYTPNAWIGLAVSALFVGRLVARGFSLYIDGMPAQAAAGGSPFAGMQRSPLTLGIFFLMAAYYMVYYAGVVWKSRT